MIRSKDRSGWIGASDSAMVMGNWTTPTWHKWWATKLGIATGSITTTAMLAGTYYEHPILDALGIKKRDRQIKLRRLRLRVNLDGEDEIIHEVKTYKAEISQPCRDGRPRPSASVTNIPTELRAFKVTRAYWQQAQVEMFAAKKRLVINAYPLTEAHYQNFFLPVNPELISEHPIAYDAAWIKEQYLPRLRILARALRKGVFPRESTGQDPARG